jgi:hypothetical protein
VRLAPSSTPRGGARAGGSETRVQFNARPASALQSWRF